MSRIEEQQSSESAMGVPVQLVVKTKDPFDLELTDGRHPPGDWGLDEDGTFFLPLTWDGSGAHIRSILKAFKEATCEEKNPDARLEFAPSLSKGKRGRTRGLAAGFGLGTNSSGVGEERFLTVYTSEQQAKKAMNAGCSPTEQQQKEALDMWRYLQAVGGEFKKFSQNEVAEMLQTGQIDPQLTQVYQQWKLSTLDRAPAVSRQQGTRPAQELFGKTSWLSPDSGQVGQVFYNKMYLSDLGMLPENGQDSYWTPEAPSATLVLSQQEVIPTQGLTHALVCTDTRLADDSYVLKYFPATVALSVVCSSDGGSMRHRELVECPHHPSHTEEADGTSSDTSCDCTDKRVVEITHPISSHKLHANFCVLRYASRVRLVVTSATFSEQAWTKVGQLGWFCDLPVTLSPEVTAQQPGHWMDPHPLGSDLSYILYQLDIPQQTVWAVLTGADFSAVSEGVRLIPSVPGKVWAHQQNFSRVGLVKLAELLAQVPWPEGQDPPVVYQSPHVDCSGCYWLHSLYCSLTGQYKALFVKKDDRQEHWKEQLLEALNHIQVVHPWGVDVEDVSQLLPSYTKTNMSWEGDMWSNLYDTRQGSYGNVPWNAKAVIRTCGLSADNNGAQYGWLLLGSHTMTQQSWGELLPGGNRSRDKRSRDKRSRDNRSHNNPDPLQRLYSWELSVLIAPQLTNVEGVPQLLAPDLNSWDLPGKPHHLLRCPPGGLPLPTLLETCREQGKTLPTLFETCRQQDKTLWHLETCRQQDKTLWHLVGQVQEVRRNGQTALIGRAPHGTQSPSKLPLDEWPGKENDRTAPQAILHINVVLLTGEVRFPPQGRMVDMLARMVWYKDTGKTYLCVQAVLHTWEAEPQAGRHCNEPDCHQHGPRHPDFAGLHRLPHDIVVVGLDLDPKEPLLETYPDPKPPPGRDRLIGRFQSAFAGPYAPRSGPGSKQDYGLEVEAVWQRYFTGL